MVSQQKPSLSHHLMFLSTYENSGSSTSTTKGSSSNSTGISFSDTGDGGVTKAELFQKELTPSDVGKLNRLVVPKKHAVRWFPAVPEGSSDEVLLEFMDRDGRAWAFRYCYWKSSQSYVFTKGWNKFVRDKELKAKDVVVFYRCEEMGGLKRRYCVIDVARRGGGAAKMMREFGEKEEEVVAELGLGFGVQVKEKPKKVVKLFGVCIGG